MERHQATGQAQLITSPRNPRIVAARKLDQRKYRQQLGQFLVEGLSLLTLALDAGARPTTVFYCPDLTNERPVAELLARFAQTDAELVPVSQPVLGTMCEREPPEGIVATFALFEHPLDSLTLHGHELILVLDRLQDPGNLGTLIRTADAVGAAAVILIEPCVDPFDPKTVRGTMGSLFNLPVVRTSQIIPLAQKLKRHGLRIIGADAHNGILWGEGIMRGGVALVLGNEARGISSDIAAHLDAHVTLPVIGKAESLNVAVAGGVLMYTWLRENKTSNVTGDILHR